MCADHQHAASAAAGVRDDVLRGRPPAVCHELQLDDRARRGSKLRSDRAVGPSYRDRRGLRIAEGAVEQAGFRVEDEQGDRAGVVCVSRLHAEEAGTPACERNEAPDALEVARLAAIIGRDYPRAKTAFRCRRRVIERFDSKLPSDRCDLDPLLDALPILDERKSNHAGLVPSARQLSPNVTHRRAIARGARGSVSPGTVGNPLESAEVCTHARKRKLARELGDDLGARRVLLIGPRIARDPSS